MDEDSGKKMRGRARGRGRGRARGRVRGRTKKPMKVIESDDEETSPNTNNEDTPMEIDKKIEQDDKKHSTTSTTTPIIPTTEFDLEADISQLEAPTFTTLNRGPPEPMLRLRWDHRVNLIGEKVLNPMIHCCDKCLKPILIYGRMIPCKHVFCLSCGKREDKVCPRCMDKVSRVEQTGLGTVFMCTHGGTRYGNAGCRRTYLSQRDLQAHINHRHILVPPTTLSSNQTDQTTLFTHTKTDNDTSNINKTSSGMMNPIRIKQIQSHMATQQQSQLGNDPRVNSSTNQTSIDHRQQQQQQQQQSQQQQQHNRPQQIMTMQNYTQNSSSTTSTTMRTNLITVPIQDNSINHDIHSQQQQQQQQSHHYYQQAQVGYGYNVPPPAVSQNQNYYSGQVNYPLQQQQQQQGQGQYIASSGNIRPSPNGYIQQDGQYSQQQVPTSQTGWNQHQQQQFYR